jgi:hypothetical protein
MNPLAANRTGRRDARPPVVRAEAALPMQRAFVEDLDWPAPWSPPDKKAPRPTTMWVPGPNDWEGTAPTMQ